MFLALILLSCSACETGQYQSGTDYRSIAYNAALNAGVPPQLFTKQIEIESGFNPNVVSQAGAIGIAQFMPETAKGLGINPWNATDSLYGAARLMARYVAKYGDYTHALAAYNCGSGCLEWAMQHCLNFYWCVPDETQRYITMIMN